MTTTTPRPLSTADLARCVGGCGGPVANRLRGVLGLRPRATPPRK